MAGMSALRNDATTMDLMAMMKMMACPEQFQAKLNQIAEHQAQLDATIEEAGKAYQAKLEAEKWVIKQNELIASEWKSIDAANQKIDEREKAHTLAVEKHTAKVNRWETASKKFMDDCANTFSKTIGKEVAK